MNNNTKYPLLPFSLLVYQMTRWMPSVYRLQAKFIWHGHASDTRRVEQAVRDALLNHPAFSMRIDWRGRQCYAIQNNILHGKYHHFDISAQGDDLHINFWLNRILGDGRSVEILIDDCHKAFRGEQLEKDDYLGYLEEYERRKQEQRYLLSQEWLKREFADENIPVRPTIDRRWFSTLLPPKPGCHKADYSDLRAKIQKIAATHYLSADGFFSLCAALAIAEYCETEEAALTWAYEGRETASEQRIFGSLHRDIPFHIRKTDITNPLTAINQARNQIRSGIAHSNYPYTLTEPYDKRWNYAVNVLRMPDEEYVQSLLPEQMELHIRPQKYAYALLDVEIHEHPNKLELWFNYSATHYQAESIRRFAAIVRKYAEWLTSVE